MIDKYKFATHRKRYIVFKEQCIDLCADLNAFALLMACNYHYKNLFREFFSNHMINLKNIIVVQQKLFSIK